MLRMVNNLSSFLNWLRGVMEDKNIAPADIARTRFVTNSAISLLLSGTTKSVSVEMCKAISKATGIPLIAVFRVAGILPEEQSTNELIEQIDHLAQDLPKDEQINILEYVKLRRELSEKREKNEKKRAKNRITESK